MDDSSIDLSSIDDYDDFLEPRGLLCVSQVASVRADDRHLLLCIDDLKRGYSLFGFVS